MRNVLTTPEDVTPQWLTAVLHENYFLKHSNVIDVKITLAKTLPLSMVARLAVIYSADVSLPSQFFLKLSRNDLSEANSKEVEFYNNLAREIDGPPLVRCYDAAYTNESGSSHLLLEDLSATHFQPESPQPPAPSYCELAVASLAELHAIWWEHPQLGKQIGGLFSEEQLDLFLRELENNIRSFIDFLSDELSARQKKIYERLLASKNRIWGHLTNASGLTVTHGDAHWWNLLYPRDVECHRVCLFDWQLWHVDLGARDLAFMVALGGYSERMAAQERNLVRRYYDSLTAHGVRNYTWDDCWSDYRWSALRNLNVPAIQWLQGKSTDLWRSNLERAMLAYDELRCFELLDD